MSLPVFSSGEKVEKKPGLQQEMEKLPAREELLVKKRKSLKKKIDQLELFAKKNRTKNRRVALQALRRKKSCEKHIQYIDCTVKALRSIHEHIEIINKVIDLMKDITEEQDMTGDMPDSVYTLVGIEGEFDEDELLAELEKLENNPDENLSEADGAEDGDLWPEAPPSHLGFCREIINKVNDLIKDIMEEQGVTENMLDSLYTVVSFEAEFNEDELLAELENLEKDLDETASEADGAEDGDLWPKVLKTASSSLPANTDEDNIEDDLEYLRHWVNAPS